MEKYGRVNRGEEVETRVSASVVLTILKFVNDGFVAQDRPRTSTVVGGWHYFQQSPHAVSQK